jgi:hypothetical protein
MTCERSNKAMKLTSVEHIERSQLIAGVRRTNGRAPERKRSAVPTPTPAIWTPTTLDTQLVAETSNSSPETGTS